MIDTTVDLLLKLEKKRQNDTISLIPSENYTSLEIRKTLSSFLLHKYAEGYPSQRYYAGNSIVDSVEELARKRARNIFNVPYANVQPYSGSIANFAVYNAVCKPGDTVLGLNLPDGGHLTHGWKASVTSTIYKTIPYHVDREGKINTNEVHSLVKKHKPRIIWIGGTAYVHEYDYDKFMKIAHKYGSLLVADISHTAGMIAGGAMRNPASAVHIITTTTHKSLRGPRGALIMVTDLGIATDNLLPSKIDRAVFPGLQGGPHMHTIAGIARCLGEARSPSFKNYAHQIIKNARMLACELTSYGWKLVGGGTNNHMMLVDLTHTHGIGSGILAEKILEYIGITVNKNTVPGEKSSPFYPSGIRLGTPSVTTRGMRETNMKEIAELLYTAIAPLHRTEIPKEKSRAPQYYSNQLSSFFSQHNLSPVKNRVRKLARRFAVR